MCQIVLKRCRLRSYLKESPKIAKRLDATTTTFYAQAMSSLCAPVVFVELLGAVNIIIIVRFAFLSYFSLSLSLSLSISLSFSCISLSLFLINSLICKVSYIIVPSRIYSLSCISFSHRRSFFLSLSLVLTLSSTKHHTFSFSHNLCLICISLQSHIFLSFSLSLLFTVSSEY